MNKDLTKNLIIAGLTVLVVALAGGFLLYRHFRSDREKIVMISQRQNQPSPAQRPESPPPASPSGRPPVLSRGEKLTDSALFKYAFKVFPGNLSADAQKATNGFTIEKQAQADGSTLVKFIPRESSYQAEQFMVKPGYSLYFVEQSGFDDNLDKGTDINLRDDYGIIVDADGVVQ